MLMRFLMVPLWVLTAQFGISSAEADETGASTYQSICRHCHGSKFPRAPQFGDAKAWKGPIREGQVRVTIEAWLGVGAMPPRGGKADLEMAEFAAAVAYMARSAGAPWQAADENLLAKMQREEQKQLARRQRRSQ